MLGALGRYIRAVGYLLTGRVDAARKELSKNPYVIQATFDKIVQEKTRRINQYKDAVASLIAQEEKKLNRVKQLTDDVNRLEQLKEGAAAKARQIVNALRAKGLSPEQMKSDPEFIKCQAAFTDFSSTLAEKSQHITELEGEIKQIGETTSNHKLQLQQLLRDLDKIREEASATVADVITAKEEQDINNMLAGISMDGTAKELQEMRDMRQQMKAGARVSRELAGTDTKRQEAEFLEYSRTNVGNAEFEKLIGLAQATDAGATESTRDKPSRVPET